MKLGKLLTYNATTFSPKQNCTLSSKIKKSFICKDSMKNSKNWWIYINSKIF